MSKVTVLAFNDDKCCLFCLIHLMNGFLSLNNDYNTNSFIYNDDYCDYVVDDEDDDDDDCGGGDEDGGGDGGRSGGKSGTGDDNDNEYGIGIGHRGGGGDDDDNNIDDASDDEVVVVLAAPERIDDVSYLIHLFY